VPLLDSRLRGNDSMLGVQRGEVIRQGLGSESATLWDASFSKRVNGGSARAGRRGVQRGEAPLRSSSSPKNGGKGVEERW